MVSSDDVSIGCGGCNSRYHPTRVCMGLLDRVIDAIKEYSSKGVSFSCTFCRVEEGSGSNGPQSGSVVDGNRGLDDDVSEQAVKQLFKTVISLCCSGYPGKQYDKHN